VTIPSSKAYKQADEAAAFAHIKALAEKEPVDDEAASELWLDAEATVDAYIDAAESRSMDLLPSRQELGESCFWLLFQTKICGMTNITD
jgi:phage gp36-like protein